MGRSEWVLAGALALASCSEAPQNRVANEPARESVPVASNVTSEARLPADRAPLAEPDGPMDPKSAQGAGQVVQSYGALIEQRRFPEAEQLWSDQARARQFSDSLGRKDENHLEIGAPGDVEGAAGSIYVTVPVVFYGKQAGGKDFRRAADVILRRVNDVPGSTEAQRRWHIERIDWKN